MHSSSIIEIWPECRKFSMARSAQCIRYEGHITEVRMGGAKVGLCEPKKLDERILSFCLAISSGTFSGPSILFPLQIPTSALLPGPIHFFCHRSPSVISLCPSSPLYPLTFSLPHHLLFLPGHYSFQHILAGPPNFLEQHCHSAAY